MDSYVISIALALVLVTGVYIAGKEETAEDMESNVDTEDSATPTRGKYSIFNSDY